MASSMFLTECSSSTTSRFLPFAKIRPRCCGSTVSLPPFELRNPRNVRSLVSCYSTSSSAVVSASVSTDASAKVIDGKSVAKQIREEIAAEVSRMKDAIGVFPGLAVILVGDRKDSATYVRNKKKACESVGINSLEVRLPKDYKGFTLCDSTRMLFLGPRQNTRSKHAAFLPRSPILISHLPASKSIPVRAFVPRSVGGNEFVHSDLCSPSLQPAESAAGQSTSGKIAIGSDPVGEFSGEKVKKRKKLKGKRAVVRWLKFFRWKKKKEYERMSPEEKILYKLTKAKKKEARIVEALNKIEPSDPSEAAHDPEILTPEEHFFFLKMGLRSKNYVPVGRRGIYQGVILNMHLHWKKHQTLQVVVKTFSPEEVKQIAVELARLTGGIVLDIHEENIIIMYRGKNYSQPPTEIMSPRATLSRKKALDKSKHLDGLRAVRKFIPKLEQDLALLQSQHKCNSTSADEFQVIDSRKMGFEGSVKDPDQWKNGVSSMDVGINSDSEDLSDIFETDSDEETDEKAEAPLYLEEFEKFQLESDVGSEEDLEDHLRRIPMESRKADSLMKDADGPEFDEVDQIFLHAASLLRRKKR